MKFQDIRNTLGAASALAAASFSLFGCGSKEEPVFQVGAGEAAKMQRMANTAKSFGIPDSELERRRAFEIPSDAKIEKLGTIETLEVNRPVGEIVGPDGNLPDGMDPEESWTVQHGGSLIGDVITISWGETKDAHKIYAYIPDYPEKNADKFFAALGRDDLKTVVARLEDTYNKFNCRFVSNSGSSEEVPNAVYDKLYRIEDVRTGTNR